MTYLTKTESENPIVFNTLKNAYESNKVSHAYLFSAPHNQEIINEPMMLIELLINDDPFASKLRNIDAYPDMEILDGSESLIKKDDVTNATIKLQEKALDVKGVKILLIKNIENTNINSVNSLLKSIEEPTKNTFIIMTTNNISEVIPTIKSRAQVINIKKLNKDKIVDILLEKGIPSEMCNIIANVSDSAEEAIKLFKTKTFNDIYKEFVLMMKKASVNKSDIIIGLKKLITKKNLKLVTSLLKEFLSDIWKYQLKMETSFSGIESLLEAYNNFDYKEGLMLVNDFIVSQKHNVNFELYKSKLSIGMEACYG